jgi:Transposase IS116/IS110/IS902 family
MTLSDARGAIDALVYRREQLEREIIALLPASPWRVQVGRLRCLRGVDTLTAVRLCAEIGDLARFARAGQLSSYIGLVRLRAPPASSVASVRSPRPGPVTPGGCWSRPPGTTASAPPSARHWPNATPDSHPKRSPSPGRHNAVCTAAGHGWTAPSAARSSPWLSPESWPDSAGRSASSNDPRLTPPDPVGWVGGGPARAGNPRSRYEQPAPSHRGWHPRS